MADNPKEQAERLMGHLNRDKAVHEIFADAFERQYSIYGKSPKEWRKHFRIEIPESPDVAQCKVIAAKIAALIQEAMFYYAAAEAQVDAINSGMSKEYNGAFNALVTEYKADGRSLPAAKTLEMMAQNKVIDLNGASENAKIIKNFWKRIIEGLTEVRKNLELATWNNSTQSRQEMYGGGGNIANTPKRREFGSGSEEAAQEEIKKVADEW